MKSLDEEQLLQRIKQGDKNAMAELYRRYAPHLYAVCRRYLPDEEDAKDTLQESFIKIFSSVAAKFEPKRDGALKAWAKRVTVNCALNHIRDSRQSLFVTANDETLEEIPDEEIAAERLPAETAQRLIGELPTGYRTVFNLFAIEGMSHKEIASMLGISENTSASQYHRAKRLLKTKIKKHLNK